MGVKCLWVVFVFLVLLLGFGLAGSAFLPDTGNESNGLLIAIAGVAIAGGILVLKRKDPIAEYIETQMEIIEKQNLSAAWVDAERLKEFIEELKQTPGWERYRGLIEDAERLILGVEKAYHQWGLEIKKEQVQETIRSPSPFDDIALYFSTGMLSWEDPFDIVSWGHAIAGNIDLESEEQAFENIVRIKAEQMLELEDNMGTIEHSKPLGILKQGLMSPFTTAATVLVGEGLGIGAKVGSFLSKHELLATGLKAGDYAFNAMYVGSVVNDLREGNYEEVMKDLAFFGLIGGISKIKLKEVAYKYGDDGDLLLKEIDELERRRIPGYRKFLQKAFFGGNEMNYSRYLGSKFHLDLIFKLPIEKVTQLEATRYIDRDVLTIDILTVDKEAIEVKNIGDFEKILQYEGKKFFNQGYLLAKWAKENEYTPIYWFSRSPSKEIIEILKKIEKIVGIKIERRVGLPE